MFSYFLSLLTKIKKRKRRKIKVKVDLLFQSHVKKKKKEPFHLDLLQNVSLHPKYDISLF